MPILTFDKWTVNTELNTLKSSQGEVQLEPKTMKLLMLLAEHQGRLVSRQAIMESVWRDTYVSDNVVWHAISDLRNLLGDSAQHPKYIETIPKSGYRMICPLTVVQAAGAGATDEAASAPAELNRWLAWFRDKVIAKQPSWGLVIFLGTLTSLLALRLGFPPVGQSRLVNLKLPPPSNSQFLFGGPFGGVPQISPSGEAVAFVAESAGRHLLFVQQLSRREPTPLMGTEGAGSPFWSPDGREIGFFANGKLMRIRTTGGPVHTVCDAPRGLGGSWSADGTILFAPEFYSPLFTVPSAGGVPEQITELGEGDRSHRWPFFLPDGRHYLLRVVSSNPARTGVYAGSLLDGELKLILTETSNAVYCRLTGELFFVRDNSLLSQRFDLRNLQPVRGAIRVVDSVQALPGLSVGVFSVSQEGTLIFGSPQQQERIPKLLNRAGAVLASYEELAGTERLSLSPDGKWLAVDKADRVTAKTDIWVMNLEDRTPIRFTLSPAVDSFPVWSPDGESIVFCSDRSGELALYRQAVGEGDEAVLLLKSENEMRPQSWSPDGRFILFERTDRETKSDLWILPLDPGSEPYPFAASTSTEYHGQFSPDGRWISYISDESLNWEVYIEPFPQTGARWQVSSNGGFEPRWSNSGSELYYISPDRVLTVVGLRYRPGFQIEHKERLFRVDVGNLALPEHLAVVGSGQSLIVNTLPESPGRASLTVQLNWPPE